VRRKEGSKEDDHGLLVMTTALSEGTLHRPTYKEGRKEGRREGRNHAREGDQGRKAEI
jgi:hypothetical protein